MAEGGERENLVKQKRKVEKKKKKTDLPYQKQ
jgi:hypothetical protein